MGSIIITKEISATEKEEYGFTVINGNNIVFTHYTRLVKPAGKRLWRVDGSWDKYRREQDNTIVPPELTLGLRAEALDKYITTIRVMTWDEFRPSK